MEDPKKQYAKLNAVERNIAKLYHQIAVQLDISDSEMWVLYSLSEPDAIQTQNSIAEAMGVPKQTINSAINVLIRKGYIYQEKLTSARNSKSIHLTDKGIAYCREAILPILRAEEKALGRLSEKELEIYIDLAIRHGRYMQEELSTLLAALGGEPR